jgi:threonine synthase
MKRCWDCCGLTFEGEVCPNCGGCGEETTRRISLGEGNTPLYCSGTWPNVWIKDERQNPTGTFKDRQAAMAAARAMEQGATTIVLASTGNTAKAMAAYVARAGLYLRAFLPARSRPMLGLSGCSVYIVDEPYDRVKVIAEEVARNEGHFYARGMDYVESMAPIAYEILDDLGRVPDWYVQAVSGGIGPIGVCHGFQRRAGSMPRVLVAQPEGCAPMVRSFEKGLDEVESIRESSSYVVTLGSGSPNEAYKFLKSVGASFVSVSDDETRQTVEWMARVEGILMEPAAGVAFAALRKAFKTGIIPLDALVVVNCSGR